MYSTINDVANFKRRASIYYSFDEDETGCEGWDNPVFCIKFKGVDDVDLSESDFGEILLEIFSIDLSEFSDEACGNCFELNEEVSLEQAKELLAELGISEL